MKKLLAISLAACMVLSMAACSANTTPPSGQDSKVPDNSAKETNTLELWSRGNQTDTHAQSVIDGATKYEAETGVKVNVQFIPHADAVTKWNAAFASGTAPDVMDVGIVHIAERVKLGHILPLDKYYDTWESKDDLYPAMKEVGSFDNKWYAVAHFPDPQIFTYRKDMFREAGLDDSRPPKDWTEMLSASEKLTIKDAQGTVTRAGFSLPTQGARFLANILIRQNGSAFADEVLNKPTMTTPEAIETMELLQKLQKCTIPFNNESQENNPLIQNSAAMGYIPMGLLNNYIKKNPEMADKFGFAACVPGKEEATWCGVWFYTVTSQSKAPDKAFGLIAALTSPENLKKRVETVGLPSTFQSSMEQYVEIDPVINQAAADAVGCGYGNPKVVWAPLYEKALDQACEEVFYGVKTPEQALKDAEDSLLKEIK